MKRVYKDGLNPGTTPWFKEQLRLKHPELYAKVESGEMTLNQANLAAGLRKAKPASKAILLSEVRLDGGTQARVASRVDTIEEYKEALAAGATFPPVEVFHDGDVYWLADGFHRHAAHVAAGREEIDANIHQGTCRDAILFSVGANANHGLRRTNMDKRRAVELLLEDDEWRQWSDNQIARQCGVSQPFVGSVRLSKSSDGGEGVSPIAVISETPRTYTTRHGTVATMNTSRIGRRQQSPLDQLIFWWEKASEDERQRFLEWIEAQSMKEAA